MLQYKHDHETPCVPWSKVLTPQGEPPQIVNTPLLDLLVVVGG